MKAEKKARKIPFIDCGVIIGRFQIDTLTEAHRYIINTVKSKHSKVIILLGIPGITPVPSTRRNPLDFESRKQMILESFPNVIVSYVKDMKSDEMWSKQVDERINDLISPHQKVLLYGSRDSFIKYYSGKFDTKELIPNAYYSISGTNSRNEIKASTKTSSDFRSGVIWANENRFFDAIAVVDVAVFNNTYSKILLGKKSYENEYRFFGGFVDVSKDRSYEETGFREVKEEAGISTIDYNYITSLQVCDWRYTNESSKIYTTLFSAVHGTGEISPSDDIFECRWFDFSHDLIDLLVEEHRGLFNSLYLRIKNNG